MAVGDTIPGQIRIVKEETIGHRVVIAGSFGASEIDHKADPENSMYINPDPKIRLPIGARAVRCKGGVFSPGEVIDVQHLASALEEAATYNADEFFIGCLEEDLNTGRAHQRQLTAIDTTLVADATTSTTVWTSIFKYTVPDRRRIVLAGPFNVAAVETA